MAVDHRNNVKKCNFSAYEIKEIREKMALLDSTDEKMNFSIGQIEAALRVILRRAKELGDGEE